MYNCLYHCNAKWQNTNIWRKIDYFRIRYQLSTWIQHIVSNILQPSSQKFCMLPFSSGVKNLLKYIAYGGNNKNYYGHSLNRLCLVWMWINTYKCKIKHDIEKIPIANKIYKQFIAINIFKNSKEACLFFTHSLKFSTFSLYFEINIHSSQK